MSGRIWALRSRVGIAFMPISTITFITFVLMTWCAFAPTANAEKQIPTLPLPTTKLPAIPQPTSAFITYCKANAAVCAKYIYLDSMIAMIRFAQAPPFCIPESAMSSNKEADEQIEKVKTWLATHPSFAKQETTISINNAYRAIYPNPSGKPCP